MVVTACLATLGQGASIFSSLLLPSPPVFFCFVFCPRLLPVFITFACAFSLFDLAFLSRLPTSYCLCLQLFTHRWISFLDFFYGSIFASCSHLCFCLCALLSYLVLSSPLLPTFRTAAMTSPQVNSRHDLLLERRSS